MEQIKEQKCQNCGGTMVFDPEKDLLRCEFCGSTIDLSQENPDSGGVAGFDFDSLQESASVPDAEALPIYNRRSCGAEIIAAPEQMTLTCPYCRNNLVMTEKVSGSLRPDGVVPFKFTADRLPSLLQEFYKDKILLPKDFFSAGTMSDITGVYVPFWIFNGDLKGLFTYSGQNTMSHREGDYNVINTAHYILNRDAGVSFRDLPVDVSGKIDDALMDSLEPFDLTEARPFDIGYLAGFAADRFDVPKKDISERAEKRMRNSANAIVDQMAGAGYMNVHRLRGDFSADMKVRYLLLPVYLFSISHNGTDYSFAVNGQTGKVVGNIPTDGKVSRNHFLKRFLIAGGIVALIVLIKYLLGW